MHTTDDERESAVLKNAIATLDQLLTFKLTVDIQRYMSAKQAGDFRSFEAEVAVAYPFRGAGVLATRALLEDRTPYGEQGFYHDEVPLGAHEVGAYIDDFPLDAAASSYAFTILEVFGNEVAALTSPTGLDRNKAWHEDIKGFADLRDPVQVRKARIAFGKHFGASEEDVPAIAAERMVGLKRARNDFAHDGYRHGDFSGYLEEVLAVICHITFLVTSAERLSVYPFEDHVETFSPRS